MMDVYFEGIMNRGSEMRGNTNHVETPRVLANENVLGIEVIRVGDKYGAHYVGEDVTKIAEGSTPYMAVRALIDAFNTTDVWNRRYGFD